MGGQRFAASLQQRDSGLDDGALFWGQHEFSLVGSCRLARCEAGQTADNLFTQESCPPGNSYGSSTCASFD
jgi:hypothetical protein